MNSGTSNVEADNGTPGRRLVTWFVVTECVLLCGNLLARVAREGSWLPHWATVSLALLSAAPLAIFGVQFFRLMRQDLDEMVQRIVLEGLAFAMVVLIPLSGALINARAAGLLRPGLDPPEILLAPSILVALGMLISWRRLR